MTPQTPQLDFSHYRRADVNQGDTAIYVMDDLDPSPHLIVKPAMALNPPYFNQALKRPGFSRVGRKMTASVLRKTQEADVELYPLHVIERWTKNVFTKTVVEGGKEKWEDVPYSVEACQQWVAALPWHVFQNLRVFCMDVTNFRDDLDEAVDVEERAGNSSTG